MQLSLVPGRPEKGKAVTPQAKLNVTAAVYGVMGLADFVVAAHVTQYKLVYFFFGLAFCAAAISTLTGDLRDPG